MNKIRKLKSQKCEPFEQNCFDLLTRIGRLLRQRAEQEMLAHSLSPAQLWFLKRLEEAGEPQPISSFADGVVSNRSNATQMVDRLEAEGLVSRIQNPNDRRSTLVELTELGIQRLRKGNACQERLIQALLKPLSADERATALRVFERIHNLLDA